MRSRIDTHAKFVAVLWSPTMWSFDLLSFAVNRCGRDVDVSSEEIDAIGLALAREGEYLVCGYSLAST